MDIACDCSPWKRHFAQSEAGEQWQSSKEPGSRRLITRPATKGMLMIYPVLPVTVDSGIDKDEKLTYECPLEALLSELSEFAR